MKVEIRALREALGRVARVDKHVLFQATANQITITARNIDCKIVTTIGGDGADIQPVYLNIDALIKALQFRAADLPAEINVRQNLSLRHGEFSINIPLLGSGPDPMDTQKPTSIIPSSLKLGLMIASAAVSIDEKMPVLLQWENEKIRTTGMAKGPRLIHIYEWTSASNSGKGRFSMSKEAATQIAAIGEGEAWWCTVDKLFISAPDTILRVNTVRDSYPKIDLLKQIESDDAVMICTIDRAEFEFAVKCASSVLGDDTNIRITCDKTTDGGVAFQLTGRNSITQAVATEWLVGKTQQPAIWDARVNALDVKTILANSQSSSVTVIFAKKSLRLVDGGFVGFAMLMG